MATREMQLISRIIRTGNITEVLEWGITPEDFLVGESRAMFNHLLGYYARADTSGSVIGAEAAAQTYPNFEFCDDDSMTTPALCKEVRNVRLTIEFKGRMQQLIEMADQDIVKAAGEAQAKSIEVLNLSTSRSTDVRFTSALDTIMSKYEMKEQGIDLACGHWPWGPFDEAADGIQSDDYVVFYGRPKSMKSWVLAAIIAHIFNCGKRAIIYTKEMTPENIFMRVAAAITEIRYQEFRKARLSTYEKDEIEVLRRMLSLMKSSEQLICLSGKDAPEGGDTVPWLRSKAELYNPDFIFVDGLYLMSDVKKAKAREERITNISRMLRDIPLSMGIPIIATLQANRKASGHEEANLDELAYSDAISQDATFIIRVINEKSGPNVQLVIGGSREFEMSGIRINAVPATDFSFHSLLTEKEIQKAKEQDAKSEGNDDPKAHAKKKAAKGKTEKGAVAVVGQRMDKMV